MANGSWLLASGLYLIPFASYLTPYALHLNILHKVGHAIIEAVILMAYGLWLMVYAFSISKGNLGRGILFMDQEYASSSICLAPPPRTYLLLHRPTILLLLGPFITVAGSGFT